MLAALKQRFDSARFHLEKIMYWAGFEDVYELPTIGKKCVMYVLCDEDDDEKVSFWEYKDNTWQEVELGIK